MRTRAGNSASGRSLDKGAVGAVEEILPEAARPYFRAQRVRGGTEVSLEPSFAVVVVNSGDGALTGDEWQLPVRRGTTVVVPWGAGKIKVEGQVEFFRCLPPLPADAATDDPDAGL